MSSQGVSVFRPQSEEEILQKASSSTQTAISVYFGSSFPIQLLLQLEASKKKKTESRKKIESKKEKEFEVRRKKEIEEFKKFSSKIDSKIECKTRHFLHIKKTEPYVYDPYDNIDEKFITNIGKLLVENCQKDDGPITF